MSTAYHAKYFAHELTLARPAASDERMSASLFDASVDLNPHQIEAAHFALSSPLSKGVILADEVGLGKTIEAGLVLCQFWAERKRRLLVIAPASLRKQWGNELEDKFFLPVRILDSRQYRIFQSEGIADPFEADGVVITSFHYAARMAAQIRKLQWDLVVVDEAHKLRNAYRQSNRIGRTLKWALENRRKLLLTATPLQNSLMELYGLSSLLDDFIFGEPDSFRSQYVRSGADIGQLKQRLRPFCKRTLRKHVLEYVRYTERRPITRHFKPSEDESKLYTAISEFMKREDTYAIPHRQRHLTVLILQKLLASSSYAIAGTLDTIVERLKKLRKGEIDRHDVVDRIIYDEDIEEDLLEEQEFSAEEAIEQEEPVLPIDIKKIDAEIDELSRYAAWARGIGTDTKTRALISALEIGFQELEHMGARRKVLIFTESRRTQSYLKNYLEANGYAGNIVLFNGTNSGPEVIAIYEKWLEENKSNGRSTGSRTIDTRIALVEYFRDHGQILIATEAGTEGINLQFCSLVVNYDLPWNPQRIEQRIGRCHRYGQTHDVVVINFLNDDNAADKRVLELLQDKFNLFSGVFGASDEVLGSIESGVDFEKRILQIYQTCRTQEEIEIAFHALQAELDEQIQARMNETKQLLFESFDEDVHARLKLKLDITRAQLDRVAKRFWELSKFILSDHAHFSNNRYEFVLQDVPGIGFKPGKYFLTSKDSPAAGSEFLYRLGHPLGEYVIVKGKDLQTDYAGISFCISEHPARISVVENLKGKSGWLELRKLTVDSFEREEYLLLSAIDDRGKPIDPETLEKLFNCAGAVAESQPLQPEAQKRLRDESEQHTRAMINRSAEMNSRYFREEQERLDAWADDMVAATEKELSDTKAQIKQLRRQARQATTTEEHHALQSRIAELERQQRKQRQQIFDAEDEIIAKRDKFVEVLEKRMQAKTTIESLFTVAWKVE